MYSVEVSVPLAILRYPKTPAVVGGIESAADAPSVAEGIRPERRNLCILQSI